MKKLLIGLLLVSFMVSAEPEIGRYKVKVTTYISPKTNKLYVLETTFDTTTGKGLENVEIPEGMRAPAFEGGKKVKIFMNEQYGFPHGIQITAGIANHKPQLVGKPSDVERYEIEDDDIVIEIAGEVVWKASEDGFPDTQRGPEWVSEILSKTIETEEEKVEPEILN